MASLEFLNAKLEAGLQHDTVPPQCVGCPNLKSEKSPLGRISLNCSLFDSLRHTRSLNQDHHSGNRFPGQHLTVRAMRDILAGDEPGEISVKHYHQLDGYREIGQQAIKGSLLDEIAFAPEDCPILSDFIEQMTARGVNDRVELESKDPVTRP